LTGWTVGSSGGEVILNNGTGGDLDFPAVDGTYHVTFNSGNTSPGSWLEQTFATVAGQLYVVTFFVGRKGTGSGEVSLTAAVTSGTGDILGRRVGFPPSHGYSGPQRFFFKTTTPISTLRIVDTSAATVSVDVALDAVSVAPITGGVLTIAAQIDGLSRLVVKTNRIHWDHLRFNRPGMYDPQIHFPTLLNGYPWFPSWLTPGITDTGQSFPLEAVSIFGTNEVLMRQERGRGPVAIVQQPAAANDFTLIVEFDDVAPGGADWYEVTLYGAKTTIPPTVTIEVATVKISWLSKTNRQYQVLWAAVPNTTDWFTLGPPVEGNGETNTVFDTVFGQPRRVYRVVTLP
jgi:hypothetical protein